MTEHLVLYAKYIVAWSLLFLPLSAVFSLCYPYWQTLLKDTRSVHRTRLNMSFALAPTLLALFVLVLYRYPGVSGYFVDWHCHDNVCGPHHLYLPTASHLGHGVSFSILVALFLFVALVSNQMRKTKRYLTLMQHLADDDLEGNYKVFNTSKMLAWCAGLFRNQIYLSKGLVSRLSQKQLKFVLAHEYAHAFGHDNVKKLMLRWLTAIWFASSRQRILKQVELDLEINCDAKAGAGLMDKEELIELFKLVGAESQGTSSDNPQGHQCLSDVQTRIANYEIAETQFPSNRGGLASLILFTLMVLVTGLTAHFAHPFLESLLQ